MTITGVLTFILVIGVLVFFHELGHFLFAKLFKMKVEDFSLGFGPRVVGIYHDGNGYRLSWGKEKHALRARITGLTDYNIRLLPIGGFVRIKGMEIEDEAERRLTGTAEKKDHAFETTNASTMAQEAREVDGAEEDGFNTRPIYQRFWVIFGGPLFSFALGWLALCLIGVTFGLPKGTPVYLPVIESVVAGKPADTAGIKAGDKVVSIDGTAIKDGEQMVDILHQSPGKKLSLEIQSPKGDTKTISVTPEAGSDATGKTVGLIGVAPKILDAKLERVSAGESFAFGTRLTGLWFTTMANLFTKPKELGSSVGGPVAILRASQDASSQGGSSVLGLLGQLSLSLGLFNLFPIPVLDGGHLALMFLEAIRRRKLTAAQTQQVFTVGFALIMLLAAVVLFKDVSGFIKK